VTSEKKGPDIGYGTERNSCPKRKRRKSNADVIEEEVQKEGGEDKEIENRKTKYINEPTLGTDTTLY